MFVLFASQVYYTGNTGKEKKKALPSLSPHFDDKHKPNFD